MAPTTVTVMFTDLVGSTELLNLVGEAAADEVRREHFRVLRQVVANHDGREVKNTGDGLMLVFSSVSGALEAACSLQQAVTASARLDQPELAMRVGIAHGEAHAEDGDFFGTPVVEAARLCAAAGSGQILCAGVIQAIVSNRPDLELVPVGELALKGFDRPIPAAELRWSVPKASVAVPAALELERRLPLVGRTEELRRLITAGKEAVAGRRAAVLLSGEPGIGKTRVAAELAAELASEASMILHGLCFEDLVAPFAPWTQVLAGIVARADEALLREHLAEQGPVIGRLVNLGSRLPEHSAAVAPPIDPASEKLRVVEALDALLCSLWDHSTRPVVIVLDDLHWADEASLAALSYLCRSPRPAGLLVVGTYRDTDLSRRHPLSSVLADLRRTDVVQRVDLGGLGLDSLSELVEEAAGQAPDPELADLLYDETEGNPFFLLEVLQHLAESGAYVRGEDGWRPTLPLRELGIPEGVREVLGRRLSRLPEGADEALWVAAVMGREFEWAVLERVLTGSEPGSSQDRLAHLEAAVRAGLLTEDRARPGWYAFSHALVRQTLLEEMSVTRRSRLHWRIGQVLAGLRPASLDLISFHLCRGVLAGDAVEAAEAAIAAGDQALARFAYEECILHYDRALSVLQGAGGARSDSLYRALLGRGAAAIHLLDTPMVLDCLVRAGELARAEGWSERAAQAVFWACRYTDLGSLRAERLRDLLGYVESLDLSGEARCSYLVSASNYAFAASDFGASRDLAAAALDLARSLDSPSDRVEAAAVHARAVSGSTGGRYWADLSQELDEALAGRSLTSSLSGYPLRAMVVLLSWYASLAVGDRERLEQAGRVAEGLFVGNQRFYLPFWENALAHMEGRLDDAVAAAADTVKRFPNYGIAVIRHAGTQAVVLDERGDPGCIEVMANVAPYFGRTASLAMLTMHRTYALQGRVAELRRLLDDGRRVLGEMGPVAAVMILAEAAAECAARLGDPELARLALSMLEPGRGQYAIAWDYPRIPADRGRAQALLALDRVDEAITAARAAVDLDHRFGARGFEVRSQQWLAAALLRRGRDDDREEAERVLNEAVTVAADLGMVVTGWECEALRRRR